MDIYVVHGAVTCSAGALARSGYARLSGTIESVSGATLLVMADAHGDRLVCDSWELPWRFADGWEVTGPDPAAVAAQPGLPLSPERPAALVKVLSDSARLCLMLPMTGDADAVPFAAASDLDMFLLQGEAMIGVRRRLAAGGYAHIPAGDPCGPWSTRSGFVALLRFAGASDRMNMAHPAPGDPVQNPPVTTPWADRAGGQP